MIALDIYGNAGKENTKKVEHLADLPGIEDNAVSVIYAYNMMHTIESVPHFLRECHRLLKGVGFLHIVLPLAPYVNAFDSVNVKRFYTAPSFQTEIREDEWKVLNYDVSSVRKEEAKDPNTWQRTLSVRLMPIKPERREDNEAFNNNSNLEQEREHTQDNTVSGEPDSNGQS